MGLGGRGESGIFVEEERFGRVIGDDFFDLSRKHVGYKFLIVCGIGLATLELLLGVEKWIS